MLKPKVSAEENVEEFEEETEKPQATQEPTEAEKIELQRQEIIGAIKENLARTITLLDYLG